MDYPYVSLHLYYTLPPAVLLHFLLLPVRSRRDIFKITLLIVVAVISTTPWDSYLILTKVWSYPPGSVLGTIFSIPIEEYFFFVIQTYITSTIYLLLAKPIVHPIILDSRSNGFSSHVDISFFALLTGIGIWMLTHGHQLRYLGLILVWVGPFLTLLTTLSGGHIRALPLHVTCGSIIAPTAYLWFIDTMALRDGTWVIEKGAKVNWQLWGALDIEEALFFLATNAMIILGLIACDHLFAIMDAFPEKFAEFQYIPSIRSIWKALSLCYKPSDVRHLEHLREACLILKTKSRSFYLASLVFPDRCRVYLLSLYAFCRVVDDLVDDAPNIEAARQALRVARNHVNSVYCDTKCDYVFEHIPPQAETGFALLPMFAPFIPATPFLDLVAGFESDLAFSESTLNTASLPIQSEADLLTYCERVASTVAHMFVYTTWHCDPAAATPEKERMQVLHHASQMGVALQLVNIARDIVEDAKNGRTYIPVAWFMHAGELDGLAALLRDPHDQKLDAMLSRFALRLVRMADLYYTKARPALEHLPHECRKGAQLAIEVYMDIGREIERRGGDVRSRVVVDRWKKLRTVARVLYG